MSRSWRQDVLHACSRHGCAVCGMNQTAQRDVVGWLTVTKNARSQTKPSALQLDHMPIFPHIVMSAMTDADALNTYIQQTS